MVISELSGGICGLDVVLSSEGAVVHEKELNVGGVLDEEGLVSGGSHVTGLLVGSVSDLKPPIVLTPIPPIQNSKLYS
jgi:hypothetical protein